MTYDEMQQLIGFLRGAFPKLTEEQVDVYSAMLVTEDAELASKAILSGVNEWKFPPAWAEIRERIRLEQRKRMAAIPASSQRDIDEALAEVTVPAWVKRWMYARYVRKPPDARPFREQFPELVGRGEEPVEGWMPSNEYELEGAALSDEMVRAKVAEVTGVKPSMTELLSGP